MDRAAEKERERVLGKVKPVTHEQLCKAGRIWLLNTQRCRVVAMEMSTAIGETPDVVGFTNTHSRLIECKTSRGDFRADAKKIHHRADFGIGYLRWYLVPRDLVRPDEVPNGWGLLEYRKSRHRRGYYIKEVKEPEPRKLNETIRSREFNVLVSIAWRALEAQKLTRPLAIEVEPRDDIWRLCEDDPETVAYLPHTAPDCMACPALRECEEQTKHVPMELADDEDSD